jgi:outer membrane protein assembly factor BamB
MYQAVPSHNAVFNVPHVSAAWTWAGGAQINGGLAVVDQTVFVVDFAHRLVALDLQSGKQKWSASGPNVMMSTPVVSNGVVVIGTGHNGRLKGPHDDSPYAYAGDGRSSRVWGQEEGDHVIGFDGATGAQLWSFDTVGEDMPSPAYLDGLLVFVNGDLHAYALDPRSGEMAWQRAVDGVGTMASATAAGRVVLVSFCNDAPYRCSTNAIEPKSGAVAWTSPWGNSDSSPTVGGNTVFLSGIDNKRSTAHRGAGVAAAVDLATGKQRWVYNNARSGPFTEISSNERAIAGTYADGTYYQAFPTSDEFIAFDAKTGTTKWRFASAGPIKMSCVVDHGMVYVADTVGMLYVLDARDGRVVQMKSFRQPFTTSPPVIVDRTLLVVNGSAVMAFPLAAGRIGKSPTAKPQTAASGEPNVH